MHHIPRLTVAGLRGGSGKTILSLGLAKYWQQAGWRVKPFKKGPDYIDAVWLGRAAGHTATNLDPFLMSEAQINSLFV
ncbi:MAG: cobyrinic acid a,c-diamide synthase, partial [Desulfovermiculus sp.]|nr:cobyrinic acid a,c-diamide synthase [Desulfovermiculus sp.]